MEALFSNLTILLNEGIAPNLTILVEWLMDPNEGFLLGLFVIVLPLLSRIVNIFTKLFK